VNRFILHFGEMMMCWFIGNEEIHSLALRACKEKIDIAHGHSGRATDASCLGQPVSLALENHQ